MREWTQVPFGDLLKESVRNGIYKSKEFHGTGANIVNMGELFAYPRLRDVRMKRVELNSSELDRFSLKEGDLIFARRSLTAEGAGKCSIVLEVSGPTTFESSIIRARPDPTKANPLFLYYFFSSPTGLHRLDSIKRQVAVAGITGSDLTQLIIPKPPLEEQIEIASILGVLDNKIDLNRQINETLEAMARAIFKDWFVDFGPTRAKMEGRAPYLAPEIWSLFPDRLDDEGKPEGWEEKPLRYLGSVSIGGYWGDDNKDDTEKVQFLCLRGVDLEHLRDRGECQSAPIRWGKIVAIEKRQIKSNDVLIAASGAGPCGRSLWLGDLAAKLSSIRVTYSNFVKLISCRSKATACFLDRILLEMRNSGEIWSYVNGTSVPNLNDAGLLDGKRFVVPPEPVMEEFAKIIRQNNEMLFSGESATLAATRDLLLPKLMSGEIRVKDAEKIMEAVA
ncbi:restriction endonuclease subunit S [Acidocella sp. KAb 2-4]|uniref:restriction endonuclease subunit S n=1 Tax=Acidocella sp. KAb 2-4 TaxID=2885158 RepID=UPI001D061DAC|nr:restriction endonuclease subunit S [Acidocella sp. KAb 2-4]MCB5945987.1 restriction endonuclease subunit S [Acidocella sp. KAb 2-4]